MATGDFASTPFCVVCDGQYDMLMDAIVHKDSCPIAIPHTTEGAVSGKVVSLTSVRMEKDKNPSNHAALDAIYAALAWVDEQPEKPDHVVVILGRSTKAGGSATKFFQTGSYPHHAQMGLCFEAMQDMRDSG